MGLDNRSADDKGKKNAALAEIENDDTPIIEDEQPSQNNHNAEDELAAAVVPPTPAEEIELDEEEETPPAPVVAPKPPVPPVSPKDNLPTPEERLRYSGQEAQILDDKTKTITGKFKLAQEVKEPTDDELTQYARMQGVEWNDLSIVEKLVFKKAYVSEKKVEIMTSAVKDIEDVDQWASKVDDYIDENERNQTHKLLIGKEAAFRSFCMNKSHRGASFDLLVSAFLGSVGKEKPKKKSGSLFNVGGGGEPPNPAPADIITSPEESAKLRAANPREWQRKLKAGKIKVQVD